MYDRQVGRTFGFDRGRIPVQSQRAKIMITMKNVQPGRILVCAFFESARHRHCKQTAFRSRAGAGQSRKAKGILVPLLMIEEFGVKAGRGNAMAIGGRKFQLACQGVSSEEHTSELQSLMSTSY